MRNPFAKKKKATRGKSKSAKEIALKLDNDFIKELKTSTDPEDRALYKEKMLERAFGKTKRVEKDRLTETVETLKLLKDAGLVEDPRNAGGGFDWKSVLQGIGELGKMAPSVIEQFNGGGGSQQSAHTEPAADPRQELEAPQGGKVVRMSMLSRGLILKVQNPFTRKLKAPAEVADMLLERYNDPEMPMVKELVDGFCQTPDEQMGQFIQHFAARYTDLYGFLAWADTEERRPWFGQCILAVRQKMGAEPADQGAEASGPGI